MLAKIKLKPGQTIIFTGDSITDADRLQPPYKPLGYGYVHFTANYLLAKYPTLNLNIINTGVSGDTTRDLKNRWQKDCLDHNPDILSVMIGVNDLWRQFNTDPALLATAVQPKEHESNYRYILERLANQHPDCQLVMMEPFMFCDDPENKMFAQLRTYIDICHKLAKDFDATLVKLQAEIDKTIGKIPPQKWSSDCVHPYLWAHAWISQSWLKFTGL